MDELTDPDPGPVPDDAAPALEPPTELEVATTAIYEAIRRLPVQIALTLLVSMCAEVIQAINHANKLGHGPSQMASIVRDGVFAAITAKRPPKPPGPAERKLIIAP